MAELFDSYRSTYGEVVDQSIGFSGLKHDFFMRAKADILQNLVSSRGWLNDGPSANLLDVGCGVGTLHPYLDGMFNSISGCDVSTESVDQARINNPNNDYRSYQGTELPFGDENFDMVLAVCVVHHVPPCDWEVFFSELHRVVRPGGVACIIEHNPLNPATRLAVLRCPFDEDAVLLGAGKAQSLLCTAGFAQAKSKHFLLMPSEKRAARGIEKALAGMPLGAQYLATGARV